MQLRAYQVQVLSAEDELVRNRALVSQAMAAVGTDLFRAAGNTVAWAARRGAGPVPMVFVSVGNSGQTSLVNTLARPGGHITSRTCITLEPLPRHLETLG